MRLLLLSASSFLFLWTVAQPRQQYSFRHITQSDGLLNTDVRSILQDERGYIWILLPNGLQRYDGSRFVTYRYELNNADGIINTALGEMFLDNKTRCLLISYNGRLQQFDLSRKKFTLYCDGKLTDEKAAGVTAYSDENNRQWCVNHEGIFLQAKEKNGLFAHMLGKPLLAPNKNNFFITDTAQAQTWLVDYKGLHLFDAKTAKVYTHDFNSIHHPLLEAMPWANLSGIMKDSEQNIWISTGRPEFYKYNAATKKLSLYSLKTIAKSKQPSLNQDAVLNVTCFFEDNHGVIWAGTSNTGLLEYNLDKDTFTQFVADPNNQQGLHYNYTVQTIFQDQEENIWVGTDNGINIFNPYIPSLQSVHHQEGNAASLAKNEIQGFIQAANGDILAGTWGGGLTLYDSAWNFKKNIYFANPYEYNMTWSFAQNNDGYIWVGCQHGYIHIYNPANETIRTVHPPEIGGYTIRCMAKDAAGNIWMGLHNGKLAEWNNEQKKFYRYSDTAAGIAQTFNSVYSIFFDQQQRCWVSTEAGFKQFDTEKRIYSAVYLPDQSRPGSLSAAPSGGIEQLDDTTLIIATIYGGLNFFNTTRQTFRHLSTKDGLPSSTFYAVKKDANANLWLTTDYDLYKYKPAKNKFIRYAIEPGIVNSAFKPTGFYPLRNGQWLTATATEMISFDPESKPLEKATDMKVEITGFHVFDSTVQIDSLLAAGQPLRLSHGQNFLTIEFSLLRFLNHQQTGYYYRLNSVDKDWVDAGTKNFASYTNLAPGEYTFSVKAEGDSYTTPVTSFTIIISPPFYLSWWFTLLTICVIVATGYYFIRRRIGTIRYKAHIKQRIAEAEINALRAQMNPHFIFNCLSAIDNLIQTSQTDKATTYLARFAKLIRSVLESSKNNLVPFYKDFETLQLFLQLEQFRCNNKFTYELTADEQLLNGDYKVPPLIVQPFVENAIHHGLLNKQKGEKRLSVKAVLRKECIHYIITDNGVGRARAAELKMLNKPEQASYGMQITTERIQLHNGNEGFNGMAITDLLCNGQPCGTQIDVQLKTDR